MKDSNDTPHRKGLITRTLAVTPRFRRHFTLATSVIAGGILGLLACVGYTPSAAAQPATVQLGNGDDLRPVLANAEDVAEGKSLADSSCAACHGAKGVSATPGVPNLAAQRPMYLYRELKAYQSGARGESAMNNAVKFLSDAALVKVAAYFASLDPVQPVSTSEAKSPPAEVDPVEAGKAAAAVCAGCHGEAGVSTTPGTPSLVGLDPKYLVAAMQAYKGRQRKSDVMNGIISSVADADMSNIALYYALQKPSRAQTPAAGDKAPGKAAAAPCAACHGDQGVSGNPATPSLAGQDAEYIANALLAYKSGGRQDETMKGQAAPLGDGAIKDLAAYYASLEPQPPNVRKPLSAAEWAQRCDRCHGTDGNSSDPRFPALAAQRVEYLAKALHAYRTGARTSPEMAAMSGVLTKEDVASLAEYYARQKARAVVYVVVRPK
ncbi:MAG: c-type cytochrome [Alphaproteobacteria bacterium]